MKKILFATTNKGKVQEARFALKRFGISVEPVALELPEARSDKLEEIATGKAVAALHALRKPVVVDDTGFYLSGYKNFPGAFSKWVANSIGREGILALARASGLRGASFKTVVAFAAPGLKRPKLFRGVENGRVSTSIGPLADASLPYDPVFIPCDGKAGKVYSQMGMQEKLANSSRAKAFEAFAKWFAGNGKKELE